MNKNILVTGLVSLFGIFGFCSSAIAGGGHDMRKKTVVSTETKNDLKKMHRRNA